MLTLLRDGFARDLAVLLIAAVLVGSAAAYGLAAAADTYFGDAVGRLIGDVGEFDVILHVREEAAAAAQADLPRMLEETLPGALVRPTVTVAGTANLLVAAPDEARSGPTMERLAAILRSVPGYNGHTFILQPSVTVRNTHPAIRQEIGNRIEALDGVAFAFADGDDLIAAVEDPKQATAVAEAIRGLLSGYQRVELRFPLGFSLSDPPAAAGKAARALRQLAPSAQVEEITAGKDAQAADTEAFLKALTEMKRLLLGYATSVHLRSASQGSPPPAPGELVALAPSGDVKLEPGSPLPSGALVVEVIDPLPGEEPPARQQAQGGQQAREGQPAQQGQPDQQVQQGMIVSGDLGELGLERLSATAYRLTHGGQRVGEPVGTAELENPRLAFSRSIDEAVALLERLDRLAQETQDTVGQVEQTLQGFERALDRLAQLQAQVVQLQQLAQGASGKRADQLLLGLVLGNLAKRLAGSEKAEASEKAGIDALSAFAELNLDKTREGLAQVATQVEAVRQVDARALIDQAREVQERLPRLSDEEAGRSVRLIDQYLRGQVIPGERLEFLLRSEGSALKLDRSAVEKALRKATGHPYATVVLNPAGVVNPDARAALVQVLSQVRGTIAGLIALAVSLLWMLLDFSTVLSAAREVAVQEGAAGALGSGGAVRGPDPDCGPRGWRRLQLRFRFRSRFRPHWRRLGSRLGNSIAVGGSALGALLVTGVYLLSGARVPYVTTGMVALAGALLGLAVAGKAPRISPVRGDEILAARAMGLSYAEMMRQIVIPEGRPGLLYLLNRRRRRL